MTDNVVQLQTPVVEEPQQKIKILTLTDHPMSMSGIGIQARQLIAGLLDTGRFSVFSIGAAQKHVTTQAQMVQPYNHDWIIQPVEGFGNPNLLRQWIMQYQPDAIFLFTDPRFFTWVFQMEDEIRDICPIFFWTVWDNEPAPMYNDQFYSSVDDIAWFSKFSHEFHQSMVNKVECNFHCIPLARDHEMFKILSEAERRAFRIELLTWSKKEAFTALFVSRNARRKRSADLMHAWKLFIQGLPDEVKNDKDLAPQLIMHCDPMDVEGPNLYVLLEHLGMQDYIKFSPGKCSDEDLCKFYNSVDVTLNFSMNEGFGMSVHESLLCGTPVVAAKTGGIPEQMTDGETVFGRLVEPTIKTLAGSQLVPYIYEDMVPLEDFAAAI